MTHSMLEARASEVADRLSRELPGAVIVVAPDGVILFWNDEATALFGYSSAVVGRSIFDNRSGTRRPAAAKTGTDSGSTWV